MRYIYIKESDATEICCHWLYIVALSIRKVDLRVDEVQGVINQVDLSGRSMKGWSGTTWGKPWQSEWGWRWPDTWCSTGCYCTVGHTSVNETCESLESHSSWGPPTTARRQDQRSEGAMLYLDYSLLIVPSLFALMSSVAGVGWGGAVGWSMGIEYSHIKDSTLPAVVPEVLGLDV